MTNLGIAGGPTRAAAQVETRSSSYSDLIVSGLLSRASGATSTPDALGVLEACAGLWSRSFAVATVNPMTPVTASLTAAWRARVARNLLRRGESLDVISVEADGQVVLLPATGWTVRGASPREADWFYEVDLQGPDMSSTRVVSAASVVHVRLSSDSSTPWRGKSPLQFASDTGLLAAGLERSLGDEASGPTGSIIPVPRQDQVGDADDTDPLAMLQQDIAGLRGRPALIETTAAGWAEGRVAAPVTDWKANRVGGNPPAPLVSLRQAVENTVMSACGVPPGVFGAGQASGQREALRTFYRATVLPIAEIMTAELTIKLDTAVTFDFKALGAADIATSARACATLVKAGLDITTARELSGLS